MLLDHRILMVHVMVDIVWMGRKDIEERIVLGCSAAAPPHLCPWVRSCSMVVYNVDDDGKTT